MDFPLEKIRVLRMIEYIGTREWLERTLEKSIQGTMRLPQGEIRTTIVTFPELVEEPKKRYQVSFFLALQEMEGGREEHDDGIFEAASPEEAIEKCIRDNYFDTQDKDYLRGCLSAKEIEE